MKKVLITGAVSVCNGLGFVGETFQTAGEICLCG